VKRGLAAALAAALALAAQEPTPRIIGAARAVLEWAPDGRLLVAAGGLLARFDLDSDQEELLDSSGVTFAVSPGEQPKLLVAGGKRLELRSYPTYELLASLPLPEGTAELTAVAWSPDGETLAAGTSDGHTLLSDAAERELWADLTIAPPSAAERLVFSGDAKRLLTAFADGRAVLWDLEAQEVVRRFEPERRAEADTVTTVAALSPDGRRILVSRVLGEEAEVSLRDDTGAVRWRRAGYGLEFTRDGAALVALAPPYRIAALYRASDAAALRIFEPPAGVEALYTARISPDGTTLVGVGEDSDGQVLIVWDFATAKVLKTRR